MNISECLSQFERVRKSSAGATAKCPGPNHKYGDRKSSLSITEGDDGRVLLNCHAGCTFEEICAAMRWKPSDLFRQNGHGNARSEPRGNPPAKGEEKDFRAIDTDVERMQMDLAKSPSCQQYIEGRGISLKVATDLKWGFAPSWSFKDDEGDTVHKPALAIPHHVRGKLAGVKFRTIDGTKLFSQMPGSSTEGLYALGHPDPKMGDVLVLEGPEDAALAISHDFNAVAINAAGCKLGTDDVRLLSRYERISLLGDQDIAGQKAMDSAAAQLPPEKVIRVRMPGYKDVGDLWKSNPASFQENLKRILRFARASRVHFQFDDLLTESEVRTSGSVELFAVDQLIPLNSISMFFSEEKGGKSLLMTYILKCVANKVPVFGKYATRKMPVVVLDLEASDADIASYLSHFSRIGPEQIRYLTRKTGVPSLDSPALLRLCEREHPLLLVESLTKFVSATSKDESMFDPAAMSRFFDKVLDLCAAGATPLITHHATRADAERYADSHQIGAAVARAYVVVSEDRPQLHRVRLEGKLCRGAEPITENLIAFPLISDAGMFGLSADNDAFGLDLEKLLAFVKSQPGEACFKETIKKRPGKRAAGNLELLDLAIKRGILVVREDRKVAFPNSGTPGAADIPFPNQGTDGNGV